MWLLHKLCLVDAQLASIALTTVVQNDIMLSESKETMMQFSKRKEGKYYGEPEN